MTSKMWNNACRGALRKLTSNAKLSKRSYSASSSSGKESVRQETAQASKMTDIGCRKIFTEEHDLFRQSVRKFMQTEIAAGMNEFEEAGAIPKEYYVKAGSQGMLGINIPAEFGGHGADFQAASIVLEELCYANVGSFGGVTVHSDIVMPYICHYGTPEQINQYIPDMMAGRKIGAIAMTEPGAGSDIQGIKTNAKKDGSDWILNGSKVFITNGLNSDVVIVVAKTDPDAKTPAQGISLFMVDKGLQGFEVGRNLKKMGSKASDTTELYFDNVRLSADTVLGQPNKGFYYLMKELPQERLVISVMAVAHMEFMFEETRTYVKERKAFGKSLINLQVIQHKLAEMKTEICVARTFVDHLIQLHEQGQLDSQMASMAKYWTTDLQTKVAHECVQLHGGWGYMWEMPICRAFVDARVQTIYGGANEIMKELIARSILKD